MELQSGTKILAIFSGTVTYTGFSGAGGFTVTVKSKEFTASYCHVSPQFIVSVGEYVLKGTTIANVGPKNVYGVLNNPYKDSFGNPTNGATTGPHLHLTIKKRRPSRQSIRLHIVIFVIIMMAIM